MAQKVAVASTAWSAATTWNSVTNTPTLHASTNISLSSITGIFTATFTAPNTTNACVGVLFHTGVQPVGATYVVTLQESTVDTAATVSIVDTAFPAAVNWIFFKFPTPYVFTTTGAGAYRFKITRAAATTNATVAADSGGTLPMFLAVDNRTGVPAATDDVWIVTPNGTGTLTVTMDGTQTIGGGGNTTGLSRRSITNAVTISYGGLLNWDIVASATLTSKGNITSSGTGELRIGTVAVPYPSAFLASLIFNENGTTTQYGLETYSNGKLTLQGAAKTPLTGVLTSPKYISGVGTAASPLVVSVATNWVVGDEILVGATGTTATNYQETENKFIKTVNSSTSFVLSDTVGGAESAFTYTHTIDAWVLNVTRNILIKSSTTTEGFYYYNENATAGDVDIDHVRFETMGSTTANKEGIGLQTSTAMVANCDYSVAYRSLRRGFVWNGSSATATCTGLIACNQNSGTAVGAFSIISAADNKTLVDCFAIKNNRNGFQAQAVANITFTRCVAISNNLVGTAATSQVGGFTLISLTFSTLNSCEAHCNRVAGLTFNASALVTFNTYLSGSKGTNAIDINIISASFNFDVLFFNSMLSSATIISNYLAMLLGSEIRFHKLNQVENSHFWYTARGSGRSSGAGLSDTNVRTAGTLNAVLRPESITDGQFWEFNVLARASSAVSASGFIQKNAAFSTDTVVVDLFLPGSTVADATYTMPNNTSYNSFSVFANYTGTVPALATVRITGKTVTAAAYAYVADLFNGTNDITNLKTWHEGKPAETQYPELGDPDSVWSVLKSVQVTPGQMGYEITADLDDIQARVPAALTAGGNIKADTLMIEGVDATNQIRDSILTDATRFAGANIATILAAVDTEVATLITNVAAILAAVDTEVAAIKVKTDNLPTDPADESNIQAAITSVLSAIAALNNPSTAAIVTAIFAGLIESRSFEEILKDIWAQTVADFVANDADEPTEIVYEGPDGATQLTHTLTDTTRTRS